MHCIDIVLIGDNRYSPTYMQYLPLLTAPYCSWAPKGTQSQHRFRNANIQKYFHTYHL